jgi:hypothetical protein
MLSKILSPSYELTEYPPRISESTSGVHFCVFILFMSLVALSDGGFI